MIAEKIESVYSDLVCVFSPNHLCRMDIYVDMNEIEIVDDMTEEELMHMTADWGQIVRLKVLNYEDATIAFVDFGYEEEANYFVEAIDKTPLEYLMVSATRVDSIRPE